MGDSYEIRKVESSSGNTKTVDPRRRNIASMSHPPSSAVTRQRSEPVLFQRTQSSLLSKGTSISKHYELNEHILNAFESLYLQNRYRVAYAIGMQFVETALLEIPQHGYFYSKRHEGERFKSSHDAVRVTHVLEDILKQEQTAFKEQIESELEEREKKRLAKLSRLAEEQRDNAISLQQYERERRAVEKDLRYSVDYDEYVSSTFSLCGSLLEYSDTITAAICPTDRKQLDDIDLPVQLPLSRTNSELELEQALFLSGLQLSSSSKPAAVLPTPPASLPQNQDLISGLDVQSLCMEAFVKFSRLCDARRIRISRIDTYQGRLAGSINGCTVIAPLLCIHHFHNHDVGTFVDTGLPDEAIRHVIDEETPTILSEVRELLGLTKDALIIPSDVHDFFIQRKLLSQDQFVTVVGGNILSSEHIDAFVDALVRPDGRFVGKRMAATLFYHEHVVAIHRLHRGERSVVTNGKETKQPTPWFDFIDSLPYEDTLSKNPFQMEEVLKNGSFSDEGISDSGFLSEERQGPDEMRSREHSISSSRRMPAVPQDLSPSSSFAIFDEPRYASNYTPHAARIRCVDEEGLKQTLRWFACSKLSPENKSYINAYDWDDLKSDFDPRVFQAFVWAEK